MLAPTQKGSWTLALTGSQESRHAFSQLILSTIPVQGYLCLAYFTQLLASQRSPSTFGSGHFDGVVGYSSLTSQGFCFGFK